MSKEVIPLKLKSTCFSPDHDDYAADLNGMLQKRITLLRLVNSDSGESRRWQKFEIMFMVPEA